MDGGWRCGHGLDALG
uniref:PPR5 n=1 Tax=Arundo donax TaxID=35708 RepID=A0A0A9HCT1_ARUDO